MKKRLEKLMALRKGQAATEFLMTYGWAVLVVIIAIGAVAYFGVLNPSSALPEKCTFPISTSCVDHQVGGESITLMLLNGAGSDMVVSGLSASSTALGTGSLGCSCNTPAAGYPMDFMRSMTQQFVLDTPTAEPACDPAGAATACSFRETKRDKNRYNITVFYSWAMNPELTHQLTGELMARKP